MKHLDLEEQGQVLLSALFEQHRKFYPRSYGHYSGVAQYDGVHWTVKIERVDSEEKPSWWRNLLRAVLRPPTKEK